MVARSARRTGSRSSTQIMCHQVCSVKVWRRSLEMVHVPQLHQGVLPAFGLNLATTIANAPTIYICTRH